MKGNWKVKIDKSLDGISNGALLISAFLFFIGMMCLGDDFFLMGFAIWFTNIPLLTFQDSLFPLLHFTIGDAFLIGLYIKKIMSLYGAKLTDPDMMLYTKLAIPLVLVIIIYILIIVGNKVNNKYLTYAKLLHLVLIGSLVLFIFL